jgi:hypothetical protein
VLRNGETAKKERATIDPRLEVGFNARHDTSPDLRSEYGKTSHNPITFKFLADGFRVVGYPDIGPKRSSGKCGPITLRKSLARGPSSGFCVIRFFCVIRLMALLPFTGEPAGG